MIYIDVITWLPMSSCERLRVSWEEHDGRAVLQLRVYERDDDGRWYSTNRGLVLDIECWRIILPALRREVVDARAFSDQAASLSYPAAAK